MEKAKRIGSIYLRLMTSESKVTPRISGSEQKDPIAERFRVLIRRIQNPQFDSDQIGEERILAHTLGREILDLVEKEPVPLYVSLYHELKALKVGDPVMHLRVVGLLTTVQADKLRERQIEREPVIPQQRLEITPDHSYADHLQEMSEIKR